MRAQWTLLEKVPHQQSLQFNQLSALMEFSLVISLFMIHFELVNNFPNKKPDQPFQYHLACQCTTQNPQ